MKCLKLLIALILTTSAVFASAKSAIIQEGGLLLDLVPEQSSIGILPLENSLKEDSTAGFTVAELMVNLANAKNLKVVERAQLNEVFNEQSLIASGAVSDESAVEIGELLAAEYLVTGRISELMGERLVTMKLINTANGSVLGSKNISLGVDAFQEMQKELLGEATQISAVVFRSLLIPGWGQIYANMPIRGAAWTSGFTLLVGMGVWTTLASNNAYDEYDTWANPTAQSTIDQKEQEFCDQNNCTLESNPDGRDINDTDVRGEYDQWEKVQEDKYWDDYQSRLKFAQITWGVTAGVYLLNVIDAYIVGSERTKKLNLYFSSTPQVLDGKFDGGQVLVGWDF